MPEATLIYDAYLCEIRAGCFFPRAFRFRFVFISFRASDEARNNYSEPFLGDAQKKRHFFCFVIPSPYAGGGILLETGQVENGSNTALSPQYQRVPFALIDIRNVFPILRKTEERFMRTLRSFPREARRLLSHPTTPVVLVRARYHVYSLGIGATISTYNCLLRTAIQW